MTTVDSIVKTTNTSNDDDWFLCRAFAKAISAEKIFQILEKQNPPISESNVLTNDVAETMDESPALTTEIIQWKIGDQCLCPFSEDGLLYKATITQIESSTCAVLFDEYGNEESHPFTDLQIRTENEEEEEEGEIIEEEEEAVENPINESDILPPPVMPPFPTINPTDDNDNLSSTLMSWYLAGYHTGFYQGIKNKKH